MVFLMAADGRREPLAWGLGVQLSFNKSQSVLCHYINIFGQLLWRSGGAASHQSPRYVGTRESSGAEKEQEQKNNLKQNMENSPAHLHTCRRPRIGDVSWLILNVHKTPCSITAHEFEQEGKNGYTQRNPQLWKWNPGTQRQYAALITTFCCLCVKSKPASSHTIKMNSPKFPFNKDSENENIIFSQADGNCCFLTAGI